MMTFGCVVSVCFFFVAKLAAGGVVFGRGAAGGALSGGATRGAD